MNEPPAVSSQNATPAVADKVRWFAPSWMLATLLLFPLPWIEVGCGTRVGNRVEDVDIVWTQSGLQAAYGGITLHNDATPEQRAKAERDFRKESHAAPLMIMYAVNLSIAVVIGFCIRSHRFRLTRFLQHESVSIVISMG